MGVRFEQFELGKLFDISTTKGTDKNKIKLSDTGDIEFIGRTSVNWGIQGYTEELSYAPNPKNSFSLVQVGETVALWREREWYASQNIFLLVPKFSEINNTYLYFQGVINKEMTVYGKGYTTYPTLNKLKHTTLYLPIVMNGNSPEIDTTHKYHKDGYIPDFEYMEKYIAELEQERIAELEQYLIATGLNDYTLTDEDKAVLSLIEPSWGNEIADRADVGTVPKQDYREFRLIDLFDKKTIRGCPKSEENLTENKNGYYMYGQNICRQYDFKILLDEKYLQRVDSEHPILAYTSSVGEIGMITESFYRSGNNGAFQGLFPKHRLYSIFELQYILAILKRYFINFGYATSMSHIKDLVFYLPISQETDPTHKYHKDGYIPDFAFMERYIKAMEKVVITDVVKYKDGVIAQTKSIVGI